MPCSTMTFDGWSVRRAGVWLAILCAGLVFVENMAYVFVVRHFSGLEHDTSGVDAWLSTHECSVAAALPSSRERLEFYLPARACPGVVLDLPGRVGYDYPVCFDPGRARGPTFFEHFGYPLRIKKYAYHVSQRRRGSGGRIAVVFGDRVGVNLSCPVAVKVRARGDRRNVLAKLAYFRHFSQVSLAFKDTLPFQSKVDGAVWFGSTTGLRGGPRHRLLQRIGDFRADARIVVKVSSVVQPEVYARELGLVASDVADAGVSEQVRYKMLIDAEGNDVSTGLKWKLGSGSAVIMPRPRVSSWFMEERLVPFVHYVPVADDFSDLEQAVEWCLGHEAECAQIGENGRCWMAPFYDDATEHFLLGKALDAATTCSASVELGHA